MPVRHEHGTMGKSDFICNVLVLGRTGSGKSSLLNYLTGEKLADSGVGKPVTGEGIYEYETKVNGQPVRIFDSWGIEANKTEEWNKLLASELSKRGADKDISEWFHAIVYCINGAGHRVEDIDIAIIKDFIDSKNHIVVVCTNADKIDSSDEQKLKECIVKECGITKDGVVGTCSVSKQIRGSYSVPFGRDILQQSIFIGWKRSVIDLLPKRCIYLAEREIDHLRRKLKAKLYVNSGDISMWDNSEIVKEIGGLFSEFYGNIDEMLSKIVQHELSLCANCQQQLCEALLPGFNINNIRSLSSVVTGLNVLFPTDGTIERIFNWFLGCAKDNARKEIEELIDRNVCVLIANLKSQEPKIKAKIEEILLG